MIRSSAIALSLCLLLGCSKPSQAPKEPEGAAPAATEGSPQKSGVPPVANTKGKTATIPWLHDLASAQRQASEQERDLFIDISAEWCAPCQELEEVTFADAEMARIIGEAYVPLNLDVTEQTDADQALMAKFGVKLLPALLVVRDEKILLTVGEFIGPKELAAKLAALPPR